LLIKGGEVTRIPLFCLREGLKKKIVLHELYHHLVDCNGLELHLSVEEKEANSFARKFFIVEK
jgi:hypothetical protein